jgi:hypothetical protein
VSERDEPLLAHLATEGFVIARGEPAALEQLALDCNAEAVLLDADLAGALAAVTQLRRSHTVLSTVAVVYLGAPGVTMHSHRDAVQFGGDAFVPRPVVPDEVVRRLRGLLELPIRGRAEAERPALPPPPEAPLLPVGDGAVGAGLSPALAEVLRQAAVRVGGNEADLALPALGDEGLDELIPPELLEPLDAPLEALGDEALVAVAQHTPPPYAPTTGTRRITNRAMAAVGPRSVPPTPTITPLQVGGEMRLTGTLGAYGAGTVLGAASRSRASGLIVMRARGDEYALSLTSGHLLAIRSSRSQDEIGTLLARLGAIPREAARFAAVPLDAGVRGAAMLAAQGYLTAKTLAQALARAAREMVFDLLALPEIEWEMRALESATEIPLTPRPLDQLLVLGARARIEPETALEALGGESALLTVRAEGTQLASLPLTHPERVAVAGARGGALRETVATCGPAVLPTLLALAWLGHLRIEGHSSPSVAPPAPATALALERTRVRALIESAEGHDFFALLGVSEWTTRGAALEALEARRSELAGLRARHPEVAALASVGRALDELAGLLEDAPTWERYIAALRVR